MSKKLIKEYINWNVIQEIAIYPMSFFEKRKIVKNYNGPILEINNSTRKKRIWSNKDYIGLSGDWGVSCIYNQNTGWKFKWVILRIWDYLRNFIKK